MNPELGVVVHPLSGRYSPEKIRGLQKELGNPPAKDLSSWERNPEPDKVPGTLVLYGGDGLIQRACSWLDKNSNLREEPPILVVVAGGTGNNLERMLRKEGIEITLGQLQNKDFSAAQTIHSGQIRSTSDSMPFISVAAVCPFGRAWAQWMEIVRPVKLIPPNAKLNLAGIGGLLSVLTGDSKRDEFYLEVFTVGPNLGPFLTSEQRLTDKERITRLRVDGKKKLVMALFLWRLGIRPPRSLVSVESGPSFQADGVGEEKIVNLDGGNFPLLPGEEVTFQRSERGYRMAALVLK